MVTLPENINNFTIRKLASLLCAQSKHCSYQELHPWVRYVLGDQHSPPGKQESQRWEYMATVLDFKGLTVLDIGANCGYFSLAAIEKGAAIVHAFEGNQVHAEFIREIASLLNIAPKLIVSSEYYEFSHQNSQVADIALCLNVLHHLGDDYGGPSGTRHGAKNKIGEQLCRLASRADYCWLQLGFNWKGDPSQPLFTNGLKAEMIEFVRESCCDAWQIEDIAIYDPVNHCYKPASAELFECFYLAGEFLNRPLILLRSMLRGY
jgi:hypothetical protein